MSVDYEIKVKKTFVFDNQSFDTEEEAIKFRDASLREAQTRYQRVAAKTLPFTGVAIWVIYDEGPINVGDPPARVLQYVRGTREQAIHHALKLPGFWGYGPGEVKRIFVEDL